MGTEMNQVIWTGQESKDFHDAEGQALNQTFSFKGFKEQIAHGNSKTDDASCMKMF